MFKLMLDSTFLIALLYKDNPKHEIADKMARNIDKTMYLYLPVYELNHIFEKIDNQRSNKTKKLFSNIIYSTRNITTISRNNQKQAYKLYESTTNLSYEECLTATLMQANDMKHIISFNQNYDTIKKITRLYDIDKVYTNKLNFFKWEY